MHAAGVGQMLHHAMWSQQAHTNVNRHQYDCAEWHQQLLSIQLPSLGCNKRKTQSRRLPAPVHVRASGALATWQQGPDHAACLSFPTRAAPINTHCILPTSQTWFACCFSCSSTDFTDWRVLQQQFGMHSFAAVPLMVAGTVHGVILAASAAPHTFTPRWDYHEAVGLWGFGSPAAAQVCGLYSLEHVAWRSLQLQ